jgi:hypothetical protein
MAQREREQFAARIAVTDGRIVDAINHAAAEDGSFIGRKRRSI